VLSANDIHFAYPGRPPVLRGVSLQLAPGELLAIVGPNGAGKSTLVRLLAGVLRPTTGQATLLGQPVAQISPHARAQHLAYLTQKPDVATPMTVRQLTTLGRHARGRNPDAVSRAMQRCQLADLADTPVHELSAGQQQRASLARTLAQLDGTTPAQAVLLADEPVSSMDPHFALFTLGILADLARAGTAVGVVLHDLTLAARYATHAAILTCDGRIAATGPSTTVLTPANLAPVFGINFTRAQIAGVEAIIPGAG